MMKTKIVNLSLFFSVLIMTSCHISKPKPNTASGMPGDVYNILSNRCFQCHVGGNAEGDMGFMDNASSLINAGYIVTGDHANSPLYKKITDPAFGAKMPYGGPYLSGAEIQAIADWIDSMALTSSSCVRRDDFSSTVYTFTQVANILKNTNWLA